MSNAKLFLKNFSNEDIFAFADPDALKDYMINLADEVIDFRVTNGGIKVKSTTKKSDGPDASPLSIHLPKLREKNKGLYDALLSGADLGPALFSKGSETRNFSSVDLAAPTNIHANSIGYSEVQFKFFK